VAGENRTLQILATVRDLATTQLRRIGQTIGQVFGGAATVVGGFRKAITLTEAGITGLLAALSLRTGVGIFQNLAEGLAKVSRSAEQVGGTASSLYLLRNAAEQNGIEFDALSASLVVFQKSVGAARQGSQEQAIALRQLGLSSESFAGSQRDLISQMALVADGLSRVKDESLRTRLATTLFGDAGAKLLPLLRQGGTALREYAAAQKAAGLALSNEQLQRVVDYQRTLAKLESTIRVLAEQVVVQFAPVLTKALEDIQKAITDNAPQIRERLADLFQVLVLGLQSFIAIGSIISDVVTGWQILGVASELLYTKLFGTGVEAQKAEAALQELADRARQSEKAFDGVSDGLARVAEQANQLRKANKQGVVIPAPVAEPPPENVQSGYDKFWDGFTTGAEKAIDAWRDWRQAGLTASKTLVDNGLNGISNALADVIVRAKTWQQAFRDLAKSLLADLARIISKLIVVRLLEAAIFGSSTGGGGGGGVAAAGLGAEANLSPVLLSSGAGARRNTLQPALVSGVGGDTFNIQITAMDTQDVQRALIQNKGTIRSLIEGSLKRDRSLRQETRGASR